MRDRLLTWAAWVERQSPPSLRRLALQIVLVSKGLRAGFSISHRIAPQLFLLAFGAALLAGFVKAWRAAGFASAIAALNATLVLGVGGFALPAKSPADAVLIKVVSANIHRSWQALTAIVRMADEYDADVVSLYEAPEDLTDQKLSELFPDMPVMAMPSRTPMGRRLVKRSLLVARASSSRSDQRDTLFKSPPTA